ncbi:hypothetical protein WN51_06544, partial [Melipona quadrifasciata]
FTFTKRERRPWMNYDFRVTNVSRTAGIIRVYTEYQVVSNEPLSNLIHLLVVRAKDFLQIVPIGRHVLVQLDPSEYHFSFSFCQ